MLIHLINGFYTVKKRVIKNMYNDVINNTLDVGEFMKKNNISNNANSDKPLLLYNYILTFIDIYPDIKLINEPKKYAGVKYASK